MTTAIEELKKILSEGPSTPRVKMEPMSFVADYYATKFYEFLSPDSDAYKSVINPVFSFEFEIGAINFISGIKVFSLRDGVLPLMRFFTINPLPPEHLSLLIVDSKLSALVPVEWRKKVVLRDAFVRRQEVHDEKIVLFISPDPNALSFDLLDEELEKLKRIIVPHNELYLLFSSMRMRGEGNASYDQAWDLKCLQNILSKFGDNKVSVLSFQEYLKMDVGKSRFHFINPLQFYFTDSFLFHDAAAKGACPLIESASVDCTIATNLSFHHGFAFHQNFAPFIGEQYEKVQRDLYSKIVTYAESGRMTDINRRIFPQDFLDWGKDVAMVLFKNT